MENGKWVGRSDLKFRGRKKSRRLSKRRNPRRNGSGVGMDGMMGSTATGPSPAKMTHSVSPNGPVPPPPPPRRDVVCTPDHNPSLPRKQGRIDGSRASGPLPSSLGIRYLSPRAPGPLKCKHVHRRCSLSFPYLLPRPRHPVSLLIQYLYLFEYSSALSVNRPHPMHPFAKPLTAFATSAHSFISSAKKDL